MRSELADDPNLTTWTGLALDVARSLPSGDTRRAPLIAAARRAGKVQAIDLEARERRLREGERSAANSDQYSAK